MVRSIFKSLAGTLTAPFVAILSFVVLLCAPEFAHAASTSFFGPIISDACNCVSVTANGITSSSAPGWGCILATFQNLISFAVGFATIIITIFIALAGFTYMTSGGSAEKRQLANKRLMNAVIGLLIVLGAYLLVDSIMKVIYNPHAAGFGPWNSILGSNPGADCLAPTAAPSAIQKLTDANNATGGNGVYGGNGVPLSTAVSVGACSASTVQSAAAAGGVNISNASANSLACVAKFESGCGSTLQNYKWGRGSSAYGAFQVTLSGNSGCYDNAACEKAVGASGPLNCSSGFTNGNPIPGSSVAATCVRAASNLGCAAAAGDCVLQKQGISAWTADSNSTGQGSCGS